MINIYSYLNSEGFTNKEKEGYYLPTNSKGVTFMDALERWAKINDLSCEVDGRSIYDIPNFNAEIYSIGYIYNNTAASSVFMVLL
jgi:hypothetical protein